MACLPLTLNIFNFVDKRFQNFLLYQAIVSTSFRTKNSVLISFWQTEAYSGPPDTSKMGSFATIVYRFC